MCAEPANIREQEAILPHKHTGQTFRKASDTSPYVISLNNAMTKDEIGR